MDKITLKWGWHSTYRSSFFKNNSNYIKNITDKQVDQEQVEVSLPEGKTSTMNLTVLSLILTNTTAQITITNNSDFR